MSGQIDTEILSKLNEIPLFSSLHQEQLAAVFASAKKHELQSGEVLFKHGQQADSFYWLKSGLIKLCRISPAGDEKVIEIVSPDQTFAEAIMFMDMPGTYPVTAQAIEPSIVVSFSSKEFVGLLRNSVDTCFKVMGKMSRRLHQHINEIDRLTLLSASERLVNYLLSQANTTAPGQDIKLNVAKHVLAAHLSIKPETLSRIFTRLGNKGLIKVQGQHIILNDIQGLRNELSSTQL